MRGPENHTVHCQTFTKTAAQTDLRTTSEGSD